MLGVGAPVSGSFWTPAWVIIACLALMSSPAGAPFAHKPKRGPQTACPICQAIHMPALVAAPAELVPTPRLLSWCVSLPFHAAPLDSFAFHRASRAPPAA